MTKKAIVWEKWIDPLNSNIDEVEYPGYNFPAEDENYEIEFLSSDPDFEEKMDSYMDSGEREKEKNISINPMRLSFTYVALISSSIPAFCN